MVRETAVSPRPPRADALSTMALDLTSPGLHGSWRVDGSRSHVGFTIRHIGVATVRGHFSQFAARIGLDHGTMSVDGDVDVRSVHTGDGIRDGRLRSEFFDAEHFPAITFWAEGPVPDRHPSLLTGGLTIRGVTQPVALRVRGERPDDHTMRLVADGRIRRSDFGLEWDALGPAGRALVADHVRLAIDVVVTPGQPR
jgi:polyisoprenoid-binding protein YceI